MSYFELFLNIAFGYSVLTLLIIIVFMWMLAANSPGRQSFTDKITIQLISADWCPACQRFLPIWEQLSFLPGVTFERINSDVTPTGVTSIPTLRKITGIPNEKHPTMEIYKGMLTYDYVARWIYS